MNHLIAKVKGRTGDIFKVISANKDFFTLPDDLDNPAAYNSDYKLDDDEWFAIENFATQSFCIDLLTKQFVPTEYLQLAANNYNKLEYLCSYQSGVYYFQKLAARQLLRKNWIYFSTTPALIENEPIIVINDVPDAVYIKNTDTMYFKKLTSISSIFIGIDSLYRTATQQETQNFLEAGFIKLENGYSEASVKPANRKRIAMAMDALNSFDAKGKKSILNYIKDYCPNLTFDTKAKNFSIGTEEDLKQLLYGIGERYYTTKLGNEKRLANSIKKL
ncbi:hypothetical protein CJD36_022345 [Flavipsychrobacter stenotrophus]|uniref:ATP F0F1 synthase synthase n=1 Tax=Flavipsychrobacter stenotrophus TaxID=2077091 RepID=A0A2S7SQG0_9BACT|nr:hypothetical protein [Flavipsychrobacter stenotrophus]PQJ08796.1 hypothetical protein CJD36_022345 [Flavipsychrobacter stenotrophus]